MAPRLDCSRRASASSPSPLSDTQRTNTMLSHLLRPLRHALPFLALPLLAPQMHAQSVRVRLVTDALHRPTNLVSPPGDLNRMFVTEQWTGEIRILRNGMLAATPFLTITDVGSGAEQGLLGLAFHPDFATNGKLYVDVVDAAGTTHIREYTVSATDPDAADPASVVNVLSIPPSTSPSSASYNGGCLQFGPDGYLYQGTGDGGGGDDPQNNAQNLGVLLGKLLRIDVDGDDFPGDAQRNYAIPPSNPYAGEIAGADEVHSCGLRNPWRFSFDRVTGDLWLADAGQSSAEELNFVPRDVAGNNFGWRCTEGMDCTGLAGCTCNDTALTQPVHTYTRANGCNVVGGFVYRGESMPSLHGTYFFADRCSSRVWSLRFDPGTGVTELQDRTAQLAPPGSTTISWIRSFGEDARGELYILEEDGQLWRIEGPPPGTTVCAGDGMPLVCPCSGNGYPEHGCPNSRSVAGARLTAFGTTDPDTVRLSATRMPASTSCIFVMGTALDVDGETFGDGVRCVTGSLARMSAKTAVHGAASFPEFHLGDASVSARSGTSAGSGVTCYYQVFYRNAASFCLPASFNITNGYQITW